MADTIRDRSALIALLADNSAGDISAQDVRDVLISVHGVYGDLRVEGGATAQTGIGTSQTKMTGWDTDGESAGTTLDSTTDDDIAVGTAGVYRIAFHITLDGSASEVFTFEIAKGGVGTGIKCEAEINSTPDQATASCEGFVSCAASDLITVLVNAGAASKEITPIEAQLVVQRVA